MSGFATAATAAFAAVAAASVAAFSAAVKVGSDFEAQMSTVAAISGATATDMELLSAAAKEMGAQTQFSATEAGQAFEYMAMAGWKTTDMLDGLEGIIYAAGASGEDLARVADIITDGLTAFGYSASESGHFADVLATASANANTNIGLMGETFKYVGPIAGSLGYSIEDVAVAAGLMANSGIKAGQAGTTLRTILSNLLSPTDEQAAAMDKLGISLTNADGTIKPLNEVLEILRNSLGESALAAGELTEAEQALYFTTLGGARGMSGLAAIVNSSTEDFENLTAAVWDAEGAAQAMNEVRLDNLQGDVTILGSAMEGLGIQIYEGFRDPLREAAQAGTQAVNNISDELSKPKLRSSIDNISSGFSSLVRTVSNFAETAIPGLVKGLGFVIGNFDVLAPTIIASVAAFKGYTAIEAFNKASAASAASVAALTASTNAATLAEKANITVVELAAAARSKGLIVNQAGILVTAEGTAATTAETVAVLASTGAISAKSAIMGVFSGQMSVATAATAIFNSTLAANPAVAIAIAVGGLIAIVGGLKKAYDKANPSLEKQREILADMQGEYDGLTAEVEATENELQIINDRINEINKSGPLEITDEDELAKLIAQRDELETVYRLQEYKLKESARDLAKTTVTALESMTDGYLKASDGTLRYYDGAVSLEEKLPSLIMAHEYFNELLKEAEYEGNAYDVEHFTSTLEELESQIAETSIELSGHAIALKEGGEEYEELYNSVMEAVEAGAAFIGVLDETDEALESSSEKVEEFAETWVAANGEILESEEDVIAKNQELIEAMDERVKSTLSMYDVINTESEKSITQAALNAQKNVEIEQEYAENRTYLEKKLGEDLTAILVGNAEDRFGKAQNYAEQLQAYDELDASQRLAIDELSAQERLELGYASADDIVELYETLYGDLHELAEAELLDSDYVGRASESIDDMATEVDTNYNLNDSMTALFDEVHEESINFAASFSEVGTSMMDGIVAGINDGKSAVIDAAVSAASAAYQASKDELDIASPSKLFRKEIGGNIMKGWALGIEDGIPELVKSMEEATYSAERASDIGVSSAISGLSRTIQSGSNSSNGVTNITVNWGENAIGRFIKELAPEFIAEFKRVGALPV